MLRPPRRATPRRLWQRSWRCSVVRGPAAPPSARGRPDSTGRCPRRGARRGSRWPR